MTQKEQRALRAARRLLVEERRSQFESFTMPPHKNTRAAYEAMNLDERAAIRRFDRVIARLDAVLVLLLLAGCASYPRIAAGECIPLYGGTLVTLPTQGYRLAGGGWVPMDQIIVTRDGGVWKCEER